MTPALAYLVLVAAVSAERVAELALSARNARRALARGGTESGRALFPWMVAFHAAFLLGLAAAPLVDPRPPPPSWMASAVAGVVLAEALRWWAVASLGDRWNVRVIVVPGEPPVTRGPYAFLRHPNYAAVAIEVACLPLAWGLWRLAIAFSLANALLLAARVRDEERALGPAWEQAFAGKRRFVP